MSGSHYLPQSDIKSESLLYKAKRSQFHLISLKVLPYKGFVAQRMIHTTLSLKDKTALKHLLSPIEAAAMKCKNNPFIYKLESIEIYISRHTAMQLLLSVKRKIELITAAKAKDELSKNIPLKLRDTFDDPKIVLSLHPMLRNRLCKLECYSLFTIVQKGRSYFIEEQKFSKQNMKTLDALFIKYKCGDLF